MAIVTGNDDPQALDGTAAADIVRGFGGNDTLDGKAGADRLFGGDGNDTYIVDNAGDLVIEGAPMPFEATIASTLTGGGQSTLDTSFSSISGDGRYVVFLATSTDYTTADPNGRSHLFYKDLQTGTLSLVDVLAPGALFHTGSASAFRISADGSVIGFDSFDSGLTVPARFGFSVYSRDMAAPNVTDVSQSTAGGSFFSDISADGRFIVFSTDDPALTGSAGDGTSPDIVFIDTSTHSITVVSSNGTPSAPLFASSGDARISLDGRYVAFDSTISNLVPNDANGVVMDVYLRDMLQPDAALAITRVSTSSSGVQGNAISRSVDVSEGGAFVLFDSDATNLVAGDSNHKTDVFVKDTHTGQTTRSSTSTAGVQGNGDSHGLSISANGRYVLFSSQATNLIANDTNGIDDIFVRDRQTGEVALVSRNEGGAQIAAGNAALSVDGRFVVFSTAASLVAADNDLSADIYRVTNPLYLNATDGIDEVRASVSYVLGTDLENLVLVGSGAINGTGNGLANRITGNAAANVLDGGAGADTLTGGTGNDTYLVNDAADAVVETIEGIPGGIDLVKSSVSFTLAINVENLTLLGTSDIDATGNELRNVLNGNTGANVLDGAAGRDTLIGGLGNDTYIVDDTGDVVTEALGGGTDVVRSSVTFTLGATVENLTLIGGGDIAGNGNAGNNVITGNGGNNVLNGLTGADTMVGLAGDDTYVVDNVGDVVTEASAEGTDTINVVLNNAGNVITVSLAAANSTGVIGAVDVENVSILGAGRYDIVGNDDANALIGNAATNRITGGGGNDTLDGKAGADKLYGGNGNDTYIVDNAGDLVIEGAPTPFEATIASTLTGGGQSNLPAIQSSISGDGRYVVFQATSTDFTTADPSGLSYVFYKDLETGTLSSVNVVVPNNVPLPSASVGFGVSADGSSVGFDRSNPAVSVSFQQGVSVYSRDMNTSSFTDVSQSTRGGNFFADISADGRYVVFETYDTPRFPVIGTNPNVVFADTVTQSLTVVSSNNTPSTLSGGSSNPSISPDGRYVAFSSTISNLVSNDTNSAVSNVYLRDMLQPDAALALTRISTSSASVQGNGNSDSVDISAGGAFVLFDSDATNLVTGDSNGKTDVFVKNTHTGQTTRISTSTAGVQGNGDSHGLSISADGRYVLFSSQATNLIANDTNGIDDIFVRDRLTGDVALVSRNESGAQIAAGDASLSDDGRFVVFSTTVSLVAADSDLSSDVYRVTNPLYLNPTDGLDEVRASVSYVLGTDLENLVLVGIGAINGTGNGLANRITGNAAANVLDGGAGVDTLTGGAGNDTYLVNDAADEVVETIAGIPGGTDLVKSTVSFTLAANVENLTLLGTADIDATGNGLRNLLTGNAGANVLDGAAGRDTMIGGLGNDTYIVDDTGDVVIEALGGGTDVVRSSVTFTLAANVENLILTGLGNINGTGNALANSITGNIGNNLLNGFKNTLPATIDTLIGADGNDTYVLSNVGDVITELANEGTDTLTVAFNNVSPNTITVDLTALSSTNVIGAQNVENVTVLGTGKYNIVGDGSNNVLIGNATANAISGDAGDDTLIGLGGADVLSGGDGNDRYRIDALDTVNETGTVASTSDTVEAAFSLNLNDTVTGGALRFENIENLALSGAAAANLTGNNGDNVLTGNAGANLIDGRLGNDTMAGGAGNDTYAADTGDDVIVEGAGVPGGTDTVRAGANFTLPANVEKLVLIDGAVSGTGNELANTITGNIAGNLLDGMAGLDTLIGGDGNDTYVVSDSGDTIIETATANSGVDLVQASISFTLGANIENLMLTGGANLNGTGNALANTIVGNTGDNVLNGRGGADTLTGGDGADVFEFRTVPVAIRAATVTDFLSGLDSLHFDNAIFTALGVNGALTPGRFNATTDGIAAEADDRLIYNTSNGQLFYDTNGSAAGGSVLVATLNDHPALVATDIQVI